MAPVTHGGGILRRLGRDIRGVAAVEFAFIAPVLIVMYFAIAEFTQAMIVKRRVSHVASTIGDLTARTTQVATSDTTDIFTVAQAIMTPFPTGALKMRITSITANASNVAKVDWSDGSNWSGAAVGSTVTVPTGVITANQSVIRAEVQYVYTPPLHMVMSSSVTFNQTYYLRPRLSDKVTHN